MDADAVPDVIALCLRACLDAAVAEIATPCRAWVGSFCYASLPTDVRSSTLTSMPMVTTATHPTTLCQRKAIEE